MSQQRQETPDAGAASNKDALPTIVRNSKGLIPLKKSLGGNDIVALFTPVIAPVQDSSGNTSDPFEPLGQALARDHPYIRHIPYNKSKGITGTHVAFLKKSSANIFVAMALASADEPPHIELAEIVQEASEGRPMIVLMSCDPRSTGVLGEGFSTFIRIPGISTPELEAAAQLILHGPESLSPANAPANNSWPIWPWNPKEDMGEVHDLWQSTVPKKFRLNRELFEDIINRGEDSGEHFVVREPSSGVILGFCATYKTFLDDSDTEVIGSIPVILVREDARGRGVGKSLHNECFASLSTFRGVERIQLGGSFPRLFCGIPEEFPCIPWLQYRGWDFSGTLPGTGQVLSDWVLSFADYPSPPLASAGLKFRQCELSEAQEVSSMVSRQARRKHHFGWYDQYAKTLDGMSYGDVIVGFEGQSLVAAAIMYSPFIESPAARDMRWASLAGPRLGGVTCICIKDDDPDMVNRRDAVLVRLIDACHQHLVRAGVGGIFLDAVRGDEKVLTSIGFRKWSSYREVWRPKVRRRTPA